MRSSVVRREVQGALSHETARLGFCCPISPELSASDSTGGETAMECPSRSIARLEGWRMCQSIHVVVMLLGRQWGIGYKS